MTQKEKNIRMMHIVNLMSIAYADGKISEEENDVIVSIAQDLGLTKEDYENCIYHWRNTEEKDIPLAIPETEDEEIEYLKHFTLVMMVDGEIEDSEREHLSAVVSTFGYDPEKAVPGLIDEVYQEYFADEDEEEDEDETEEDSDEEEDEDADLFEDTDIDSQLEMGKIYLEEKRVEEAFDELFLPALRNAEASEYFMIIPNTDTRLYRLTDEQLAVVTEAADRNYSLAWYVLGRYHQVVKPDDDSIAKAKHYLDASAENIPDAKWALTKLYLYGYLDGDIDYDQYNKMLDQAFEDGSMQAFKQKLDNMIHGVCGSKRDPKTAIKIIENFLEKKEEYGSIYPDLYYLLGAAYRAVGNKNKADSCYETAQDYGYLEAGADRFENRVEGPDRDFYRETMSMLLDFACDDKDPNSFLARALENVINCNKGGKTELHEKIKEDLEAACDLGNGDAAYYMSLYYKDGLYGFEKNAKKAEAYMAKAQKMDSALACGRKESVDEEAEIPAIIIVNPKGEATIYKQEKEEWYKLANLIGAKRIAPIRIDALDKLAQKAGLGDHLVAWVDIDAPRKGLPLNTILTGLYPGFVSGDVIFSLADNLYDPMPFYGIGEAVTAVNALKAELKTVVTDLEGISDERPENEDYSKVNPYVNKGYVARIEPDGKAYIVENSLAVFALVEEDIYDPARLKKLYETGEKLGLEGNLTMWTDNSALRKQLAIYNKATMNPIAAKYYPGPVVDNVFIAMEDDDCRIMLFDDPEQLKQVCVALGVKPEDVVIG